MRLELNLPALERLIGGDTEMEVHLRQAIVEEFARKKLKTLLNDRSWSKVWNIWQEEMDKAIKERLEEILGKKEADIDAPARIQEVRWKIDGVIKEAVQKSVDEAVAKIIQWQQHEYKRQIAVAVEKAMDREIAKQVEEGIQKRLTAAKEIKP